MTHDNDPKQEPKPKQKESFSKDDVNIELAIFDRLKREKPELVESISVETEGKRSALKEREDQEKFAEDASDTITREAVQLEVSQLRNDARDEISKSKEKIIKEALTGRNALDKWECDLEKELDQLTTEASLIEAKRDTAIHQWEYDKSSKDKRVKEENRKIDADLERESKILEELEASEDQIIKRMQLAEDDKKEVARIREDFAKKHRETAFTTLKKLHSDSKDLQERKEKATKKLEGVNEDIELLIKHSKVTVSQKENEIHKILEEKIEEAKKSPKALDRGDKQLLEEQIEIDAEPGPQIMSGSTTVVPIAPEVKQAMDDAERSSQEPIIGESETKSSSENKLESQPTETREMKIEEIAPKDDKKPQKELVHGSAKYYLEYLLMDPFIRPVLKGAKPYWDKLPTAERFREVLLDRSTYRNLWNKIPSFKELKIRMEFGDKKIDPDATQPIPIPLSERVATLKQKLPDWVTPKNVGYTALAAVVGALGYVGSTHLRANKTEVKPYPVNELRITPANISSLPAPLSLPQSVSEKDEPVNGVKKKRPESTEPITVMGPEKPKKDEKAKQIQVSKPDSGAKKRSSKKKPKVKPQVRNSEKAYNWLVNSWFETAIKDLSAKKRWLGKSTFEKGVVLLGSLKSSQSSMTTEQMAEVNKALRKARKRIKGKKGSKLTNSDVKRIAKALRKQNGITKPKKKLVLAKAIPKDKSKLNKNSKKKDKKKPKVGKKKKKEVKATKPKDKKSKKKKSEKKKDKVPDLKSELAKQVGDFGTAVEDIKSKSRRELGKNVFNRLKEANGKTDAVGIRLLNKALTRYIAKGYPSRRELLNVGNVADRVIKSHDDKKKASVEKKRKEVERKAEKKRKREEKKRKESERKRKEAEKKEKPAAIPVITAEPKNEKPELPPMSPETASLLERLEKAERSLGIIN